MRVSRRSVAFAVYVVLACSMFSACAMISSESTDGLLFSPVQIQTGGSYFLPKHHLTVTVTGTVAKANVNVGVKAVADRSQLIETGLLLSPFSEDTYTIAIGKEGLLTKITVVADDKTALIIENIVKAVYSPLFRDGTAGTPPPLLFEGEFDPFIPDQAYQMNKILARYNSCIEVEIAPGWWTPGCQRRSMQSRANAEQLVLPKIVAPVPGVYYRRASHHRVHIVENGQTRSMSSVAFANLSPILRLDIDRTAFIKRETTIEFLEGAPSSVYVKKPSELLEISKLPLTIAAAIIDAPIEGLTKRQKLVEAETSYLNAQSKRVSAEAEYQKLLNSRVAEGTATPAANSLRLGNEDSGFRTAIPTAVPAEFRARCLQIRLAESECVKQYQAVQPQ